MMKKDVWLWKKQKEVETFQEQVPDIEEHSVNMANMNGAN